MRIRFLLDENVPAYIQSGLIRHARDIDVLRIGDIGAPFRGTSDPDILKYLGETRRALVTNDRSSMAGHVSDHLKLGLHHWGVLRIRKGTSVRGIIDFVVLLWEASDTDEWFDVIGWIPSD